MADMSLPMFGDAAKRANPDLTDNDVVSLYRANMAKLADLDPMSQVKAAMDIAAQTSQGAGVELPQVTVTAKKPVSTDTDTKPEDADLKVPAKTALNTIVKDPYSDTTQAAKNPNNPGAEGLSQFDPEQMRQANAAYEARIRAMQPGRDVSDYATSAMTGGEGATAAATHRDFYAKQQDLAKELSLGQQDRLQTQATAGQALANAMQDTSIKKGKYETEQTNAQIEQAGKRADLTIKELSAAQEQRLNDPNSTETKMAKEIARAHLSTVMGEDKKSALLNIINDPTVTARQLILATGTLAPAAQEALIKATGIKEKEATTEKIKEETTGLKNENRIGKKVADVLAGPEKTEQVQPQITQSAAPQIDQRAALVEEAKNIQSQLAGETNPTIRKGYMDRMSAITSELNSLSTPAQRKLPVGTNNVGNLKDPKTGEFRTFDTPSQGYEALMGDLRGKLKGGHDTITKMITRYAPPSDNNPTEQYISNVVKATGIDPNVKLTPEQLPLIANAIVKQEGNKKIYNPPSAEPAATVTEKKPLLDTLGQGGYNFSYSKGGVNVAPSQAVTGQQADAAQSLATGRKQEQVATQYDVDNKTNSLTKKSMDDMQAGKFPSTGTVGKWMANLNIGESKQVQTQIYDMIDAKNAFRVANGLDPLDRTAEADRILKSNPKAFQLEMLQFNEQVARNAERQRQLEKHVNATGTAANFQDKTSNMTYMFNPKTGQSALVSPSKMEQARKAGFVPPLEIQGLK